MTPELQLAPPHTGSGPGTPEESKESPERVPRGGAGPQKSRKSAPHSLKESEKSPKVRFSASFRTLLRHTGVHSFETFGALLPRYSFRTLIGLFWGFGNQTLCGAGPIQSRFLGRGCDEALFSEKKGFSVKRGEAVH